MIEFPASMEAIQKRIDAINPSKYASTRNFINGAVTCLSPYISRGVISTRQIWQHLIDSEYAWHEMEKLVQELAWRDYFQRVAQERDVNLEIKHNQENVRHYGIPEAIEKASTGIKGIDYAIEGLYATGYMHNHCRMYVASLACNIGGSHWKNPAKWMYYHLYDADWASNACSWQWVAGANSSKKYFANQENISKFTNTPKENTYLNKDTFLLASGDVPEVLLENKAWKAEAVTPQSELLQLDPKKPLCIYTPYNLDPSWKKDTGANRVLLWDTEILNQYPMSEKVISFINELSKLIPEIQLYRGTYASLKDQYKGNTIFFKEHPFNRHYNGTMEERDWMAPSVKGYYPSFFAYWKKVEKELKNECRT